MRKYIEANIWAVAPSGPYAVRVARRRGEHEQVTAFVADLRTARELRDEAAGLRLRGFDVKSVWGTRGLVKSPPTSPQRAGAPETVAALCARFHRVRRARVRASNPKKSGLNKGTGTLRPTTVRKQWGSIHLHIVSKLGHLAKEELTNARMEEWGLELAASGIKYRTQTQIHQLLRQIISWDGVGSQPADFPWSSLRAVEPASPMRRQPMPEVWGGESGDALPAFHIKEVVATASGIRSCGAIVVYLIFFAALRRGEAMGLRLGDFWWSGERLWVRISRQMDLKTGQINEWTKSDAAYRSIPLPRILSDYLRSYVWRYHGTWIGDVDGRLADRLLSVTSTGRNTDGSFMSLSPSAWALWYRSALVDVGLGYLDIGFDAAAHHLRRSFAVYMRRAPKVLRTICVRLDAAYAAAVAAGDSNLAAELAARLARAVDAHEDALHLEGADVTVYMGHEEGVDDSRAERAAARITRQYADRDLGAAAPDQSMDYLEAVAKAMDAFAEFELDGPLRDEDDEHDTALVITVDDPVWVLVDSIPGELAVSHGRVKQQLRDGRLDGALVYCADGDRDVPGRRWAIRRDALAEMSSRYDSFTLRQTSEVLGMGVEATGRLADAGLLPPQHLPMNVHPFYLRTDVSRLLAGCLGLVLSVVPEQPATAKTIHALVKEVGNTPGAAEVPISKLLHPRSTVYWLSILVGAGLVSERRGWFSSSHSTTPEVAAVASDHVSSIASVLCGRARAPRPPKAERKATLDLGVGS